MGSIVGFGTDGGDDGSVLDAIVKLLVADPAQCGRDGLALLVRRSLRVRGWLDAIDARVAVQASRLAAEGGSADAATVLAGGGRRSRRDSEAAAARGGVCARIPVIGEALAHGTVSAGHVDALAKAANQLDDDAQRELAGRGAELVKAAEALTPEQFERECQVLARNLSGDGGLSRQERLRRERNVRRWVDKHTGMCKTLLSLDPLADARAWTAINAAVAAARTVDQSDDARTWDQLQADVVVDLLTGARAAGVERVPEVSVLIDYATLLDGLHASSTCETADGQMLPVDTLRRLCCEANLVPIVLGGDGEALDVGRQRRLANRAQRRALRAMYRTCAHPSCAVPFDSCRIHHVDYWERGGVTALDNLIPLCETHHHLVHEGGWTLQLFADRRTIWRTPDGTVCHDGITTDRLTTDRLTTPDVNAAGSVPGEPLPRRCQPRHDRQIPGRQPPLDVATVAADLELALAEIASRASRAPP